MKSDSHFGTALAKYNGSIQYLDTYVGMSVEDIDKAMAEFDLKAQNLIPFAKDIDGGLQCILTSAGEEVVNYDTDDKTVEHLKMNYGEYLESIRDGILSNKLAYEEGLGLMSLA